MKKKWMREQQQEQIALCHRAAEIVAWNAGFNVWTPDYKAALDYLLLLIANREQQLKERML